MIEGRILYFPETGKENTEQVIEFAKQRADELGINTILVASTQGSTALRALEVFEGKKVVAVTHHVGMKEANVFEWPEENISKFEELGGIRLTAAHAFGGIGRAVRKKWNTYQLEEIVAHTLRLFGQGMKVVCEIALMAADAGLVRTDEDVVSIAGSGKGADTAVVLRPVNLFDFFDLRIKEILCKPHF